MKKVLERLGDPATLEFGHKVYEKLRTQGKTAFDLALRNPDELAPLIDNDEVDRQRIARVPCTQVLEERGIKEDPGDRADRFPDDDPNEEPFEEATLASRFPKLAARFG